MSHTIVIVDDHRLIAESLGNFIQTFRDYDVLYKVENGKMLMERFQARVNIPDIVLLDITMPVMDGFETAQWLTQNHPGVHILVLSMEDGEDTLLKMIRHGARGYLVKNVDPGDLEKALDIVVQDGYFYSDAMAYKALRRVADEIETSKSRAEINARELEFLKYVGTELSYKEIADKMCCSPRTVEGYRDHLFEKLGVRTRVGLAIRALKHGYIKLESIN